MKHFLLAFVTGLLTLGAAMAQEPAKAGAGKPDEAVAKALTDMENQWAKASKAGDVDTLAPMLSEDFVSLETDGTMRSKSDVLARVKKAKWATNELADMKVLVHGDSAIVTGSWTGKGTDASGKDVDTKEVWVDTWVKASGGKWQCVASASAPMKK